jgi:tRNA threonylcarbamoyladenosine biosynthesis protein TsaB
MAMRILSIDTSGRFDAVGLIDGHQVLADFVSEAGGNSLEDIILNVDRVLTNSGLTLADVDGLAVGIGPGFWTGVRVGITVGKILAYVTSKPLCGISSLDALAYQARDVPILLCPLVEAGRGNVYGGFYRSEGETVAKEGEYSAGPIEGLLEKIKEPVLFLGEAVELHRQTISEELGPLACFRDSGEGRRGSAIALLALSRLERGESDDALSLVPLYLKEPLAQALLAQERKRQAP